MTDLRYVAGIAVEDDGILFTVSPTDEEGNYVVGAETFKCNRPADGYDLEFIEAAIPQLMSTWSGPLSAVGISTFGLVRPDDEAEYPSARRDQLVDVPRYDWKSKIKSPFVFKDIMPDWADVPVFVENDSTTWAMTEYWELPENEQCESFVYVRVGAGVGAGVLLNGLPRPGGSHPEVGHIPVSKVKGDPLRGTTCQAHREYDCLEGMISEGAILQRCGSKFRTLEDIPEKDPVWDIVADYVVQLCGSFAMVLAPDRVMLGGRTMRAGGARLHDKVCNRYGVILGGFPRYKQAALSPYFLKRGRVWDFGSLYGATRLAVDGMNAERLPI